MSFNLLESVSVEERYHKPASSYGVSYGTANGPEKKILPSSREFVIQFSRGYLKVSLSMDEAGKVAQQLSSDYQESVFIRWKDPVSTVTGCTYASEPEDGALLLSWSYLECEVTPDSDGAYQTFLDAYSQFVRGRSIS